MANEQTWYLGGNVGILRTFLSIILSAVMIAVGVVRRDIPVIAIGAGLLGVPSISIVIAKNGQTNGRTK